MAISIALISLAISLLTLGIVLWAMLVRRGHLTMAALPTLAFDAPPGAETPGPALLLRPLLYSSRPKGHTIEAMHADVMRDGETRTFDVWRHGNAANDTMRTGGIHIGGSGVAMHQAFTLAEDAPPFALHPGDHLVTLYAREVGAAAPTKLGTTLVSVSAEHVAALADGSRVVFEREPDSRVYRGRIAEARAGSRDRAAPPAAP